MVTQGTVVSHEAMEIEDSKSYFPVIIFRDQNGAEFRFTSIAGGTTRHPAIGTDVTVRYLPSDPRVAYVETLLHMWAAPCAAFILGLAGLAVLWVE